MVCCSTAMGKTMTRTKTKISLKATRLKKITFHPTSPTATTAMTAVTRPKMTRTCLTPYELHNHELYINTHTHHTPAHIHTRILLISLAPSLPVLTNPLPLLSIPHFPLPHLPLSLCLGSLTVSFSVSLCRCICICLLCLCLCLFLSPPLSLCLSLSFCPLSRSVSVPVPLCVCVYVSRCLSLAQLLYFDLEYVRVFFCVVFFLHCFPRSSCETHPTKIQKQQNIISNPNWTKQTKKTKNGKVVQNKHKTKQKRKQSTNNSTIQHWCRLEPSTSSTSSSTPTTASISTTTTTRAATTKPHRGRSHTVVIRIRGIV
eukprot:m.172770 g.172770  ORF g.172770 m.172770 type:complete len:315 (-) comp31700_c1_seq1:297-1241(-)